MFSLMGNRRGRKVVRWGYVFLSATIITLLSALAAAGIYAILTGKWNSRVLLVGPAVGVTASLLTLLVAGRTPIQRLPILR